MKFEMAMTKNVRRLLASVRDLMDRPQGVEGMGLLWGLPGEGKSTTVAYAANAMDGIFLRANACWTVTSMLGALMVELGMEPMGRRAPMIEAGCKRLMETPRVLFIDEADYLFEHPQMLDALRDIYDITGSSVVLIGMERFARKIQQRGKFARRITQWVEFAGIDAADARTLADTVCEVGVADDLLAYILDAARSNVGRMVTALARVEQLGKLNKLDAVTRADWGKRPLFFDQPRFSRK
ncbi:MAG: ATP-binding protein [Deltaproteobacteria bacterium]|nr:ATP-binding protein [Deltaproteobacteria bacterium]MBW2672682.1 ATP-binding protein [Deltaproteobacteria bacterium]